MNGPRGLLVTHGDIGAALIRAVEGFLGPQDSLRAVSNEARSADDLRTLVERAGEEAPSPLVVFTDMKGGSCDSAARRAARGKAMSVVSGVNLPMLVEFCHYRERLDVGALVERVARKGAVSIEVDEGETA